MELNDGLKKIQVKTGRLKNGVILYNCCSYHTHRGRTTMRGYAGEIDYFAVYCRELERAYLIPVTEAPTGGGSLRVDPVLNGQQQRIRWASEYQFPSPGTGA